MVDFSTPTAGILLSLQKQDFCHAANAVAIEDLIVDWGATTKPHGADMMHIVRMNVVAIHCRSFCQHGITFFHDSSK